MKFSGVEGGPTTNQLDFGGDSNHNPDPGFLNPDRDGIQNFLKDSLFIIATRIDSQE